jgi:hypothetical protein
MGMVNRYRFLSWLLMGMVGTQMAFGLSPDRRILSLIPHTAHIVSGTGAPPSMTGRKKLLIFTQENTVDLDDFGALAGVDDSKLIRQFFMVSGRESPGARVEHSLLAIGRFNQGRIYGAALQNGALASDYRGFQIIEIGPFSRDQRTFDDLRWMAIIESKLALFGTVSNVREELDRYADHASAEKSLLQRLARLRPDDETWYLFPYLSQYDEIRRVLGSLDSRFLNVAPDGSRFQFGIHYGRLIRFDYEFTKSSPANPAAVAAAGSEDQPENDPAAESFISTPVNGADAGSVVGMISISRTQYEKWIAQLYERRAARQNGS